MRSFGSSIISNMTKSRVIGARATIRDEHLNFSFVSGDDGSVYTNGQYFDVSAYGTGFLRIAVVYDGSWNRWLYYQYVSNPDGTWPAWVNTGIQLEKYSRPAVIGGRIFYHQSNGNWYYVDFDGSSLGTPVVYWSSITAPTAVAPISSTDAYIQEQLGFLAQLSGVNTGTIYHRPVGGSTDTSHGVAVYGPNQFLSVFDAVTLNGIDYIFYSDNDVKRAYYVTVKNGIFSEAKPVVPLDVVSDSSYFFLGGVTIINNMLWISGTLKRDVGDTMHVYLYGVDHFSLGREMYITSGETETKSIDAAAYDFIMQPGKIVSVGTDLWYVGPNLRYKAPGTLLSGYDNPSKKLVTQRINQFQLNMQSNQPYQLTGMLASDTDPTLVVPGATMELEVAYGGQWGTIGKFDLNTVSQNVQQTSQEFKFTAYSYAMKRIAQWAPDSSYDLWSQVKQSVNPIDENMIRGSGTWSADTNGYATLDDLNVEGFLYTIENPARGMIVKARFYKPSGTEYSPLWGIVLNYYKESYEEVAARVGADATDADYRNNGIMIYTDGSQFFFDILKDNVKYSMLNNVNQSIPDDTWHWIQCEFHEGNVRVLYRLASSNTWTEIASFTYSSGTMRPWVRDAVGRAAIYIDNITPNANTYGFDSSATVIPVDDTSVFPTSETVIVDDEQIAYNGKTSGSPQTNLNYIVGENTISNLSVSGIDRSFGYSLDATFLRQEIVVSGDGWANGLAVYLKKTGAPVNNVVVSLYVPSNDPTKQPIGTKVASGLIDVSTITTSYAWYNVKFDNPLKLDPAKTYYIVITKEDPDTIDASNYFSTPQDNTYPYGQPFAVYSSNTKTWSVITNTNIPFKFYEMPLSADDAYQIAVDTITSPSAEYDYNDMALVAISGTGAGYIFRISGYIDITGGGVVMVDSDPSYKIGVDTVFALTPTLKITSRGIGATSATTHDAGLCSIYRALSIHCSQFEYYSAEIDRSLTDYVAEIAGKAGIDTVPVKFSTASVVKATSGWDLSGDTAAYGRNAYQAIFEITLNSGEAGIYIGWAGIYYIVSAASDGVRVYNIPVSTPVLQEFIPITIPSGATIRFSFHQGYVGVWMNGYCLGGFYFSGVVFVTGPVFNAPCNAVIDWNVIDDHIDNYILDIGTTGDQLISYIVQERRVYYGDDQDGNLRMFRDFTTIPGTYILPAMTGYSQIDSNSPTRVRLVGTDVYESIDDPRLQSYGNVFRLFYYQRLDDGYSLIAESDKLLLQGRRATTDITLSGAFDPRIEPYDVLTLTEKVVVVEEATVTFQVTPTSAVLDMEVGGYENI